MKSQAAQTWGKYDEQLKTKDRLLGENETIKEETKALMAQLEKEQGNLSIYHDKVFFVKKQIFCICVFYLKLTLSLGPALYRVRLLTRVSSKCPGPGG